MARTRFFNVKVITARSKVKSRSNYDKAQLHFLTNVPTKYELPTPYGFRDMARTRFFKIKGITARSKVKSRSNYDVAQLYPLTNIPTKYELPTPYGFQDMARTRFCSMTRHNYTPLSMFLPNTKFLHLTVSEIRPGQDF